MDRIAGLTLGGRVFLAPMQGVNDIAFRLLSRRYGSALNFTEMLSVNAVERRNKAVISLAKSVPEDRPLAVQLFGSRIDAIRKSIKALENDFSDIVVPDVFDFNMGCPVKNIVEQGAGSALLRRPAKMAEIVSAMRASTDKPVSAKIRLGISPGSNDYVKTAKIVERAGADMLIVHGRYQSQGYSGKADWEKIREIVDSVDIPVVGNGDVRDEDSARRMIDSSGCAYVMIGRAALGNPFIFRRIDHYLKTGKKIAQKSQMEMLEEYLSLASKFSIKEKIVKAHCLLFTKGMHGAAKMRLELSSLKRMEDIKAVVRIWSGRLE